MYDRANPYTLNAILEMAMVFAVEIQLKMDMGMHRARALQSLRLKHLLIEMWLNSNNRFCLSVVWQSAYEPSRKV